MPINIQLTNLIAVDFAKSWATGLKQLVAKLEKDGVPKASPFNVDAVRKWWDTYSVDAGTTNAEESHYSNWFDVTLPKHVYVHSLFGL